MGTEREEGRLRRRKGKADFFSKLCGSFRVYPNIVTKRHIRILLTVNTLYDYED